MKNNLIYLHIEEQFLSSFIEKIPNPLFYKDLNYTYRQCNNSFLKFVNKTKNDVIGKNDYDLFSKEMADVYHNEDMKLFKDNAMQILETSLLHSDKTFHDVIFFKEPIYDINNNLIGLIAVITDITEIKLKEKELIESNNQKDKLLSIISHDLKAPLGSFNNFMDIIIENYNNFNKDELFEIIKEIKKSTSSIQDLLENLFYWGRIQFVENELKIEQIDYYDLDDLIDKTITLFNEFLLNKNIKIIKNIDKTFLLNADKATMDIIIRNCIMNAVKFSYNDSEIEITAKNYHDKVEISITDHGVGISADNLEILKNGKNRISTVGTNNEKGSGLGLSLCREILKVNKGIMKIESIIDKGSTFRLIFEKY